MIIFAVEALVAGRALGLPHCFRSLGELFPEASAGCACRRITAVAGALDFARCYRSLRALSLAFAPEQMSSNRSLTKSQARSLPSIARLKIARSRLDRAISNRTRMDQTCFGSGGFFWPISNPLFQGRWLLSVGRTDMAEASAVPPSTSLGREQINLYRLYSLVP
jgi:hypothetical protein